MLDPDRLTQILTYCRIDDPTEAELALLERFIESAEGYLAAAGIREPEANTPRHSEWLLAVSALVLDAWDRRGATSGASTLAEEPGFRRLINQLKFSEV